MMIAATFSHLRKLIPKQKRHSLAMASALAFATTCASDHAQACGGFFCSAAAPVNQDAERIIFSDNGDGTFTSVIQIMYAGPAENFAWVLPIPGNPEVAVSSTQAFDIIQRGTNPTYQFATSSVADACQFAPGAGGASAGSGGTAGGPEEEPLVTVLQSGSVGPFDFDVIEVRIEDDDPAEIAVEWLSDNGYDVTATTPEVLRPYLENGLNLVAFRLQKGKEVGSLRPVSLTYESERASIPIRPTAVAANDDMGVMVWLLGEHRAIPTNYKGLELNEKLIDWFTASNYNDVVSIAADESGGQGFVTEYAQPAEVAAQINISAFSGQSGLDMLTPDMDVFVGLDYAASSFGSRDGFIDAAAATLTLRDGVSLDDFITCVPCYFNGYDSLELYQEALQEALPEAGSLQLQRAVGHGPFGEEGLISEDDPVFQSDMEAFIAAIQAEVVDPYMLVAQLWDDAEYVSRLYTTMSASEMTLDPVFDFNPDLEDVSNVHVLNRTLDMCSSEWTAVFADGVTVSGVGSTWPYTIDDISEEMPAAAKILQFSTQGPGVVLVDMTEAIEDMVSGGGAGMGGASGSGAGGSSLAAGASTSGGTDSDDSSSSGAGEGSDDGDEESAVASGDDSESTDLDDSGCSWTPTPGTKSPWGFFAAVALAGLIRLRRRITPRAIPSKS